MSAQPIDTSPDVFAAELDAINREAERCTTTVQPLYPLLPQRVWTMDSYALPVPAIALPYVRDGSEWRRIIHAAINHYTRDGVLAAERKRKAREYQTFLRVLMYLGPDSEHLARLVFRIFPPLECHAPACSNWFLPYSRRVVHCSDVCRRAMQDEKDERKRYASR